ncbi:hypothetical protein RVY80_02755 [Veillonella sp. YH-vei2233]|uniref:Transposase n=1 Tax=Veillonella absiana TaxID=3079305 RepID=A0ABU3Z775_9FIRM|nr:hypothetical protein [Veillonella sp. YH-vei2233]MDV5087765.1 hypothetical protein [Veillonella sp. YH-vei2233]
MDYLNNTINTLPRHRGRPTEYVPSRGQAVYYENRKRSGRKQRITSESPFAIWVAEQVKKANWSLDVCAGYAKKHNLFTEMDHNLLLYLKQLQQTTELSLRNYLS